jgi:hypothetical protein
MKEITEWEVLTPDGWKSFEGIVELEKTTLTIKFHNGTELTGSKTHRVLLKNGEMIELDKLLVGDTIIGKNETLIVKSIIENKNPQKVYDLVEVKSNNHQYYTNDVISHNCDELAFIPDHVQHEFMAGTTPALSATRGKMIITSTPNGSRDLFSKLWFGTGMVWDKKEYNYLRKNSPKNDFEPLFIPFWIDPEKNDPKWIEKQKRTLADPVKWKVEFECLDGNTMVNVYDKIEKKYKELSLNEIYSQLLKDGIENEIR